METNKPNQLERGLDSSSNRSSSEEHICYTPEGILEEASEGSNAEKTYSLGFEKGVPFRNAPPFFQAPPKRYNSNNYLSE